MEKFEKLGLSQELIKALADSGFKEPTEIQEKTIPLALAGKDLIGGSATGSGKTLAFGASIIDKLERRKGVQALIITPTRELAEQIGRALFNFSKYKPLMITMVYGGVAIGPQVYELERADVVVGTPGRLLDHLERGTLKLRNVKTLILDEADRMLDMGFIEDVSKIISLCPKERQTFLFSATITPDIGFMAKKYMRNPVEVNVESYVDPSKLKQEYYDVPHEMKFSLLVHLLQHERKGLVMVFCNTRHNTDFVAKNLQNNGIDAVAIHGGLTQARRNKIMEYFHQGKVFVLVCTDVAARGLDIKGVSHVYNYDLPATSKEYVHRIGRTARAGKEGCAVSLVANRDYENFRSVLRNPDLQIENKPLPDVKPVSIKLFGRGRREGFEGRGESRGYRGHGGGEHRRVGSRGGFGGREGHGSFGRRDDRRSGGYGSGRRDDRRSGGYGHRRGDSGRTSREPRRDAGRGGFSRRH